MLRHLVLRAWSASGGTCATHSVTHGSSFFGIPANIVRRRYSLHYSVEAKNTVHLSKPVLADLTALTESNKNLADRVLSGERTALARAITCVESLRRDHQQQAQLLLSYILQRQQHPHLKTFRVGISGAPGVGKSTFIEALGKMLISRGHRVAVLAVDPSSVRTGGSILGDKTRMHDLALHPHAYVRPSPSRGSLGGVSRHTGDAIVLCEAAGYDTVLVETVGVGQSETAVEGITDMLVLLVSPAGGDELQGMKKGIVELADLVVVNKSDGDLVVSAKHAQFEYLSALKYIQPKHGADTWIPQVRRCSSVTGDSIEDVWKVAEQFREVMAATGKLWVRRSQQRMALMWTMVGEELLDRLKTHPRVREMLPELEKGVQEGVLTPGMACDRLLDCMVGSDGEKSSQ